MSATPLSLLDRLRQRPDAAGWQRLVDLYTPLLQAWLRRYALQPSDVDDVVQEVLAVLIRELPHFNHNGRPGAFRCWLRTVLVHRLRKLWDRQQPHATAAGGSEFLKHLQELQDPASGLSRLWDQEHDRFIVRRLLQMIEPDFAPSTWKAFQRLVLDGADADQVAAELGLSLNAVCIAKSRVLCRLRQEIEGLTE